MIAQFPKAVNRIKTQFSAIFQKLGVTNRTEAVAYAQRKHPPKM